MFYAKCGLKALENAKFCSKCGYQFRDIERRAADFALMCAGRILLPFILVCILLTMSCGRAPSEIFDAASALVTQSPELLPADMDASDMTGALALFPESQKEQWLFEDNSARAALTARYKDVSLVQLMAFMDALAQEQWYLAENSAHKGARSLNVSYSMDTRQLTLAFAADKNKPQWPQVLSPYLAYQTPAFPFGQYSHHKPEQVSARASDATLIVYQGVNKAQVDQYKQMLADDGYVEKSERSAKYYEKGFCFVAIVFDARGGQAGLFVGQHAISPVPLPPWPAPLHLVRILPTVAAMLTVTEEEDHFVVRAEKMSLNDLYHFIKAAERYYGWSALSEQNEMAHDESGSSIRMLSFDTDAQAWTLMLSGTA